MRPRPRQGNLPLPSARREGLQVRSSRLPGELEASANASVADLNGAVDLHQKRRGAISSGKPLELSPLFGLLRKVDLIELAPGGDRTEGVSLDERRLLTRRFLPRSESCRD